ncbi:MAG: hypothetical protein M1814_000209 [Vezdaea aestivalis]|nr:MAG: hypothetical protein M1814_000209 [Vezdaea aestivalis]
MSSIQVETSLPHTSRTMSVSSATSDSSSSNPSSTSSPPSPSTPIAPDSRKGSMEEVNAKFAEAFGHIGNWADEEDEECAQTCSVPDTTGEFTKGSMDAVNAAFETAFPPVEDWSDDLEEVSDAIISNAQLLEDMETDEQEDDEEYFDADDEAVGVFRSALHRMPTIVEENEDVELADEENEDVEMIDVDMLDVDLVEVNSLQTVSMPATDKIFPPVFSDDEGIPSEAEGDCDVENDSDVEEQHAQTEVADKVCEVGLSPLIVGGSQNRSPKKQYQDFCLAVQEELGVYDTVGYLAPVIILEYNEANKETDYPLENTWWPQQRPFFDSFNCRISRGVVLFRPVQNGEPSHWAEWGAGMTDEYWLQYMPNPWQHSFAGWAYQPPLTNSEGLTQPLSCFKRPAAIESAPSSGEIQEQTSENGQDDDGSGSEQGYQTALSDIVEEEEHEEVCEEEPHHIARPASPAPSSDDQEDYVTAFEGEEASEYGVVNDGLFPIPYTPRNRLYDNKLERAPVKKAVVVTKPDDEEIRKGLADLDDLVSEAHDTILAAMTTMQELLASNLVDESPVDEPVVKTVVCGPAEIGLPVELGAETEKEESSGSWVAGFGQKFASLELWARKTVSGTHR